MRGAAGRKSGGRLARWAAQALAWGCGAVLALGCSQAPETPTPAAAPERAALWAQAQELAGQLAGRRERTLALCGLAAKASASAPDLARGLYQQAWQEAQALAEPKASVLAMRLRQEAGAAQGAARRRELELAESLEDRGRRAWPLRVVAEGCQALAPQVAAQALAQGLALAKANPDLAARDQDLGSFCLVLARRDPAAGRALAGELGDPLWRAWIWRELAALEGGPQAWTQAAQAARELPRTALRAHALAATALAAGESDPALGLTLFQEAFQSAGGLPQPRERALLQGQVAALLARVDAESGWRLAKRAEPLAGARFQACRQAGLSLLGSDPVAGRRALHEAWEAAQTLTLEHERQRAVCLLVQDLAVPDPALAREMLETLPPGENLLRGEAEAAMVLAEASRDWPAALAQAARVGDPSARLGVLMRLSAVAAQGRDDSGAALLAGALDLAGALGADEALAALARQWAAVEPRKGVDIAAAIGENVARAGALSSVARVLAQRGQTAASQWALFLAEEALQGIQAHQAIDKTRLLGDMGQEWAAVNAEVSRRFFEMGAESARKVGLSS